MDLQKIISDLLAKIQGDSGLMEKVQADPAETVRGLLGDTKLDAGQLKDVIAGLLEKLGLGGIADAVGGEKGGLLDKLKGLFGKS